MYRLGYKEVLISVSELIKLSGNTLTVNTIAVACSRSNSNNLGIWLNKKDTIDSRQILIHYNSIPQQTKTKHKLPTTAELIDRIKLDAVLHEADEKQQKKDLKANQAEAAVNHAVNSYAKYCPQYNAIFPGQPKKTIELAKIHAVLQCCIDLKKAGKHSIKVIHDAYKAAKGLKVTLKSAEKFRCKLVDFEKGGIRIVHKYTGIPRAHLVKVSAWHIARIEKYYSNPNKYTNKMVHELLTADCKEAGKVLISMESIAKYVAKPEVRNRLSVYRDKAYYRNNVQPFTRRKDPVNAADLYYADGSPVQIHCWSPDGKEKVRLNLFIVMDVKSKKVVGYDLALSEDRHNWFAAFKMAFSREMLLPSQLMHDNASATKTPEFETLKSQLMLKGCELTPTTKGEPKQKADVERWFGTFQTGFQRMIDGFTGEGIRTKRDNGRIDIEHLVNVQKQGKHYSYSDMHTIIDGLILIYNNKAERKRKAPSRVFRESERPNATAVNPADIAMLFWMCKKLKVQNSEVKMTVRHNDYFFEIYNHEQALKLDGTQVNVYYDENDLSNVHLFSLSGAYLCECRQKVAVPKAKVNQTNTDVLQIIKQSAHNYSKKTAAKKLSQEIAIKGFEGNTDELLKTANPYQVALKDVLNDAETQQELNWIKQYKGTGDVNAYKPAPIEAIPQKKKQTVQERHAKNNIVPATLEVIPR